MAWIAPATAVNGTTITSSFWNTNERDNLNALNTNSWQFSQDNNLTGGAAPTISFSNIAAVGRNLLIVAHLNGSAVNVTTKLTFNSDTGANYDFSQIKAYIDSAFAFSILNGSAIGAASIDLVIPQSNTSTPSQGEILILDYANTNKHKQVLASVPDMYEDDGREICYYSYVAGWWRNTAAITTITLTSSGGNFAQYSRATLYGG